MIKIILLMKLILTRACITAALMSFAATGAPQTGKCDQSELDVLIEQPQYINEYTSYKVLVAAKYAPWVSKTEELNMQGKIESKEQKNEMLAIGNRFAVEVSENMKSFYQHLKSNPSKTCQKELEQYISLSIADFQKWHVQYALDQKLMK